MSSVVVLDNGGGLIKAGFGGDRDPVAVVPNCVARQSSSSSKKYLIADQLLSPSVDVTSMSIRRPFDRGYLINADLQREIWDRVLRGVLHCDPTSSSLLLVEPLFNLPSIQRSTDEVVFEELGFQSMYVADSPSLVHLYETSRRGLGSASRAQCSLVLDCGFSFTHAVPVLHNFTLNYGVKRLDIGGKALTNYLKELISYRSINVLDETMLIDDAKEKLCFVSLNLDRDLNLARKSGKENPFKCTYVLPDGISDKKGSVKDTNEAQRFLSLQNGSKSKQLDAMERHTGSAGYEGSAGDSEGRKRIDTAQNEVNLTNERFLVPEILFHPSDVGMNEAGLAECIVRAIDSCHSHLHPVLFESIILTGGSTLLPQFAERLEKELRPLVAEDYKVMITCQEDPILGVWRGGSLLASSPNYEAMCVTKSEYEEIGSARCRRRFLH